MPDWRAQFGGTIEHDQPLSMIMIEMLPAALLNGLIMLNGSTELRAPVWHRSTQV